MKERNFKQLYSRFLAANPFELHFAAHSHHFWPDISREAQLQAWDDAARFNDNKWEHIFSDIVPRMQKTIAQILGLSHPAQIALAPNTHDLLLRIFSACEANGPLKILTTDSEFHSFGRQLKRWEEEKTIVATRLKGDELLTNRQQWLQHAQSEIANGDYHVVFISQVFFNSGLALTESELEFIFAQAPKKTILVVDGYHGFAAIPTNLAKLEGRIFYLGGGYKYAQAGEGVGFLVVPQGDWRPVITGWFAEFAQLSQSHPGAVPYSKDGMAFWGATLDPSGWYRFLAVWDQWERLGETVSTMHTYVQSLQLNFLQLLDSEGHQLQSLKALLDPQLLAHGHFLTWEAPSEASASKVRATLVKKGIYIDQRGPRLRFGFGVYHDLEDVKLLHKKISF